MTKLSKEDFWTLVDLLERISPKPRIVLTTKGIDDEEWDVARAIQVMKNTVAPPVDRLINPWTYEILRQAGLFK